MTAVLLLLFLLLGAGGIIALCLIAMADRRPKSLREAPPKAPKREVKQLKAHDALLHRLDAIAFEHRDESPELSTLITNEIFLFRQAKED